ncbi:C-type natriuretic peptide-like [Arapaima gigas]
MMFWKAKQPPVTAGLHGNVKHVPRSRGIGPSHKGSGGCEGRAERYILRHGAGRTQAERETTLHLRRHRRRARLLVGAKKFTGIWVLKTVHEGRGDGPTDAGRQTFIDSRAPVPVCSPLSAPPCTRHLRSPLCSWWLRCSSQRPERFGPPARRCRHFVEQLLEHYNDLLTLDDLENLVGSPVEEPQPFGSGVKVAEYPKWIDIPAENGNAWLRLLRGAVASQKRGTPDRAKRGWNRGCFGLKLDRIGSLSGLGC